MFQTVAPHFSSSIAQSPLAMFRLSTLAFAILCFPSFKQHTFSMIVNLNIPLASSSLTPTISWLTPEEIRIGW